MIKTVKMIAVALALAACDGATDPGDITLQDLPTPPRNVASLAVTADLPGIRGVVMEAGTVYFLELRTPPPLPEVLYDAEIEGTAPAVRVVLEDVTQTGTFTTGTAGADLQFVAPDGTVFEPRTSCRINVTSALTSSGAGRLRGYSDCPVTDGTTQMRVLVKFDHSPE